MLAAALLAVALTAPHDARAQAVTHRGAETSA